MAAPIQYTVKAGDTLNKIAQSQGFSDYKAANMSGFDNPDVIQPGQVLTIGGASGPVMKEVPGIGTMTITPKSIPTTPTPTGVGENADGLYARTGVQPPTVPPPPGTANGYIAPPIAGMPAYPATPKTPATNITEAYKTLTDSISAIESRIQSAATPGAEEADLRVQLDAAKSKLAEFDVESLSAAEALHGQGRGASLGSINTQETLLNRTRALERLGFATEANTIATRLQTASDERSSLGDLAQTEYNLATKRLDIALGLQDELTKLSEKEQNNARQYLLDVVNFADGKSYTDLDKDTQAAITNAVANSPITLDMVRIALQSGADKAKAAAAGELRSVAGVGVVQIDPKTGKYKVIVPENPSPTPANNAPTYEKYLADQNLPLPSLTPSTLAKVRAEYDAKYGNASVSLGKLTADNKAELTQAGLGTAPASVQSYFLNSPAEFQDTYQRDVAIGKVKGSASLDQMIAAYTSWYAEKNKSSSSRDWTKLLAPTAK